MCVCSPAAACAHVWSVCAPCTLRGPLVGACSTQAHTGGGMPSWRGVSRGVSGVQGYTNTQSPSLGAGSCRCTDPARVGADGCVCTCGSLCVHTCTGVCTPRCGVWAVGRGAGSGGSGRRQRWVGAQAAVRLRRGSGRALAWEGPAGWRGGFMAAAGWGACRPACLPAGWVLPDGWPPAPLPPADPRAAFVRPSRQMALFSRLCWPPS